jgi:hypothetical protein
MSDSGRLKIIEDTQREDHRRVRTLETVQVEQGKDIQVLKAAREDHSGRIRQSEDAFTAARGWKWLAMALTVAVLGALARLLLEPSPTSSRPPRPSDVASECGPGAPWNTPCYVTPPPSRSPSR